MSSLSSIPKPWKVIAIAAIVAFLFFTLISNEPLNTTFLSSPRNPLPTSTNPLSASTYSHPSFKSPQTPIKKFPIADKVAVIIETRPLTSFVPLLLHFSAVLGPSWPIILYTSLASANTNASAPFNREVESGKIEIRALPAGTQFGNHSQVSAFLSDPWLWEELAPAKHVLLFQADSILCVNSGASVEDFFGFDFIGAPIRTDWGEGFNGGLSLRNRELCLSIAKGYSWEQAFREETARRKKGLEPNTSRLDVRYEDQWFYKRMLDRGAKLPSVEVALTFAVETIDYDRPLGFHKPGAVFKDTMERVRTWCPEVDLVAKEAFPTSD